MSLFDQYPWLLDFAALMMGLGIILALVYFFRGSASASGFTINVDEGETDFRGSFPPQMEQTVSDFLRDDCGIRGSCKIRGRWDNGVLIVVVMGDQGLPQEQRIRNFLKLTLKPAQSK